ncbi:40252_t:CDS:1, partial [Gigaspora margarita]
MENGNRLVSLIENRSCPSHVQPVDMSGGGAFTLSVVDLKD